MMVASRKGHFGFACGHPHSGSGVSPDTGMLEGLPFFLFPLFPLTLANMHPCSIGTRLLM